MFDAMEMGRGLTIIVTTAPRGYFSSLRLVVKLSLQICQTENVIYIYYMYMYQFIVCSKKVMHVIWKYSEHDVMSYIMDYLTKIDLAVKHEKWYLMS